MNAPPQPLIPPPRSSLSRLLGRIVTVEATYSAVAFRLEDGRWVYHCTEVLVYPSATVAHVWLDGLTQQARRKLYEGQRFSFRAEVTSYERTNGSVDYGLFFLAWVK